MIKTWYNPPPISPDLPTLFYDDTGAIKHMPKPKHLPVPKHAGGGTTSPKFHTSGIKIQQPSANSVKGLSTSTSYDPRKNHYKNTGINMIHFGTDFSSSHKSSKNINGYHVSTLAPPTITQPPPHVKSVTAYPIWKSTSATAIPGDEFGFKFVDKMCFIYFGVGGLHKQVYTLFFISEIFAVQETS